MSRVGGAELDWGLVGQWRGSTGSRVGAEWQRRRLVQHAGSASGRTSLRLFYLALASSSAAFVRATKDTRSIELRTDPYRFLFEIVSVSVRLFVLLSSYLLLPIFSTVILPSPCRLFSFVCPLFFLSHGILYSLNSLLSRSLSLSFFFFLSLARKVRRKFMFRSWF